jgi:hypothetical protein
VSDPAVSQNPANWQTVTDAMLTSGGWLLRPK